ncbi:MAG: hypothetical protein WDN04_03830 [Rhodospirillales bacterium]
MEEALTGSMLIRGTLHHSRDEIEQAFEKLKANVGRERRFRHPADHA